ncbi:DUF1772 domain-containing protein [Glycomyces sp. TRM65418]|uniref:DUF1772 domain-containing protein n=1 Tax=Glycomyces sp. TRM65418 TaxID=2867006 RepID=UPI001CE60DF8|nr:DUF1772 domain-containing protein [Glycomyces sp. TRM65418]MCC3761489.1 DUF1772 domain-containing protein [Glycomyces sp. TRM65418]QZD55587.1 DUF1772 domain-containing protein [Glycomyces sp. TRM65418]
MNADLLHSTGVFAYAIALAPAVAHAAEMPRKLPMSEEDYFAVQRLYKGWALFGIAEAAALVAAALLAVDQIGTARFMPALFAVLASIAALAVFFTFVLPANTATRDWTVSTEHWERQRRRWEYGHAARGAVLLAGLVFLLFAR